MHPSQKYTPGPATSFSHCSLCFPQNEYRGSPLVVASASFSQDRSNLVSRNFPRGTAARHPVEAFAREPLHGGAVERKQRELLVCDGPKGRNSKAPLLESPSIEP